MFVKDKEIKEGKELIFSMIIKFITFFIPVIVHLYVFWYREKYFRTFSEVFLFNFTKKNRIKIFNLMYLIIHSIRQLSLEIQNFSILRKMIQNQTLNHCLKNHYHLMYLLKISKIYYSLRKKITSCWVEFIICSGIYNKGIKTMRLLLIYGFYIFN